MVIENGSIVASYLRDDVDPNEPVDVQSATKSWMSLLFGTLVDDGLLSLDETLGDIFPEDDAWADVSDGSTDFRKEVTVKELLTMTSGFIDPHMQWSIDWVNGRAGYDDMPLELGGQSLQGSLANPKIGPKGQWHYFAMSQIPSYIIMKRTGMTPRQYQAERVMEKLGIGEDEYDWYQNADGVEQGYGGIRLTPMQMAKFGQLYLQGGRTSPSNDDRVISQEWIDASFTAYTITDDPLILNMGMKAEPYGYLWFQFSSRPTVAYAEGNGGYYVCVDRERGQVVIQQRGLRRNADGTPIGGESAQNNVATMNKVVNLVVEGSLSFHATTAGGLTEMSSESVESE